MTASSQGAALSAGVKAGLRKQMEALSREHRRACTNDFIIMLSLPIFMFLLFIPMAPALLPPAALVLSCKAIITGLGLGMLQKAFSVFAHDKAQKFLDPDPGEAGFLENVKKRADSAKKICKRAGVTRDGALFGCMALGAFTAIFPVALPATAVICGGLLSVALGAVCAQKLFKPVAETAGKVYAGIAEATAREAEERVADERHAMTLKGMEIFNQCHAAAPWLNPGAAAAFEAAQTAPPQVTTGRNISVRAPLQMKRKSP